MIHQKIFRIIVLLIVSLSLVSNAQAKTCGSSASFAKDLWEKYGELALRFGCATSQAQVDGPALQSTIDRCNRDLLAKARINAGLTRYYNKTRVADLSKPGRAITKHPARLETARKEGSLTGTLGRTWIFPELYDEPQVTAIIKKLDGRGKASVQVCKHTPDGSQQVAWSFTADNGKDNIGKTWNKSLNGVKGTFISITVDGKSVSNKFAYELRLKRDSSGKAKPVKSNNIRNVPGVADLHNHMMSTFGFAGAWMWGTPFDNKLKKCDGLNHGRVVGDNGYWRSKHESQTIPGEDWPHHMDTRHQQVHWTQLKEAHEKGLNLIVMPAVSNEFVLELMKNKDPDIPHDDMDSARLQLRAANAFAAKFPWFRIAHDPWEARQIIADGDLAVILSLEVSNIMPESHGNWKDQFQEFYDLGLRHIEIAHETDSRFAGSARHHGAKFKLMNALKTLSKNPFVLQAKSWRDANPVGLKPLGKDLVREIARKKMMIEIDHLSRKSRKDIYNLVSDITLPVETAMLAGLKLPAPQPLIYYPLHFSHARFDSLMPTEKWLEDRIGEDASVLVFKTKSSGGEDEAKATSKDTMEYMPTDFEIGQIMDTGGVFGIRTGPNAIMPYKLGPKNNCLTSSRSIAQMVSYGAERFGIAMAYGTDIQGFVPQTSSRYGNIACAKLGNQQPDQKKGPPSDFDQYGLQHIGLLPDLTDDLDRLDGENKGNNQFSKVNTASIRNSAETYIRMWERAYDDNRGKLSRTLYWKTMGLQKPSDFQEPVDQSADTGKAYTSESPTCPQGFPKYEQRNPLNKDRCVKTTTKKADLKCKLLVTDKAKNWTGPHAIKGKDECRSKKGKKPKSTKCPTGYDHKINPGKDECVKIEESYVTPTCPDGWNYKSQKGKDICKRI